MRRRDLLHRGPVHVKRPLIHSQYWNDTHHLHVHGEQELETTRPARVIHLKLTWTNTQGSDWRVIALLFSSCLILLYKIP